MMTKPRLMKIGDLVKNKRRGDLALIIDIKEYPTDDSVYQFPEFVWLDTGAIDSCSSTLLEVVNEDR